jgi:hypothetical protein
MSELKEQRPEHLQLCARLIASRIELPVLAAIPPSPFFAPEDPVTASERLTISCFVNAPGFCPVNALSNPTRLRTAASPELRSTKPARKRPASVRRQLFLCIDDNYFSGSTTTTFSVPFGEGEARRRCFLFSLSVREYLRLWESWKPVFGFPLFHQPRRRSGGNGGISPAVGVISKGLVERVGSLLLAFRAFHRPVISTALLVVSFWFWHRPLHSFSPRFSVSLFFKACSAL